MISRNAPHKRCGKEKQHMQSKNAERNGLSLEELDLSQWRRRRFSSTTMARDWRSRNALGAGRNASGSAMRRPGATNSRVSWRDNGKADTRRNRDIRINEERKKEKSPPPVGRHKCGSPP